MKYRIKAALSQLGPGSFKASAIAAAMVAATVFPACGSLDSGVEEQLPEVLASVQLAPDHRVEVGRLLTGEMVITERRNPAVKPIDVDALMAEEGGVAGLYRRLSGQEPPAALSAATSEWPTETPPGSPPRTGAPIRARATTTASQRADAVAVSREPLVAASAWNARYCVGKIYDGCIAPTNIVETVTDYRDTMFYSVAAQANGGEDAFVRIWKWDGASATWVQHVYTKIPAGGEQSWSIVANNAYFQTEAWSRSGRATIHFFEGFRYALPAPQFVNNKPSDVSSQFSNDIQGITHDADNWFMTRTKFNVSGNSLRGIIAKIPFGTSLAKDPAIQFNEPDEWLYMPGCTPTPFCPQDALPGECACEKSRRYNHFGDVVRRGSFLYVGMDGPAGAAIGVWDTDLDYVAYATLDHNTKAPFVAYNPKDGYFYTGQGGGSNKLEKYSISIGPDKAVATWKGTLTLSDPVDTWQGGKFSPKGNLWLLSGHGGPPITLRGFDGANGKLHFYAEISPGSADEAEGLDIIDLDTETRPGMTGQLHLQVLRNDILTDDNWWLMHFSADMTRL